MFVTWIRSSTPVESILEATFTAFPQMSYWGLCAPITPATTGPMLMPIQIKIYFVPNVYLNTDFITHYISIIRHT